MHISKLSLVNYRNFLNSKLLFSKGINTLIGENASGKSNVFRAIRLLLDNSLSRSAYRLSEGDFCRNLTNWRGHWIIMSMTFDDISDDEVSQSLFVHSAGNHGDEVVTQASYNLIFRPKQHIRLALSELSTGSIAELDTLLESISIDDYETVLTGKSNADFNDEAVYRSIVGDFDNVDFPSRVSQESIGAQLPRFLNISDEVSLTFVKALRDVVSDFQNNRTNPLLTLLKQKSGQINKTEFEPIAAAVVALNNQIEGFSDITTIKGDIKDTINQSVGDIYAPQSLSIKSSLSKEADELFQSLKLFIDESGHGHEGGIHEMSLGGANLVYLTLKLLEFNYQQGHQTIANFLLIEEPEAHIHTHIQKTLFDKINYSDTQIFYSTHSSHISEVCKIKNVNIIGKVNGKCAIFQPSQGLIDSKITYIERYLDAIRSNLLFAKSVILVEGDAEEILIPVLIKQTLGLSLDELGISLVNIRSTGFENISLLFHDDRIRKKCSIITDLDARFYDINAVEGDITSVEKRKSKARGSEESGALRKTALDALCQGNNWLHPHYADHTFEVDFIKSGNKETLKSVVDNVYTDPTTVVTSNLELSSTDIAVSGQRALAMANYKKKGWFALTLAENIEFNVSIPKYILDAVMFSHGEINPGTLEKIIGYRFNAIIEYAHERRKFVATLDVVSQAQFIMQWIDYLDHIDTKIATFRPKWENYLVRKADIQSVKTMFINDIPGMGSQILEGL
jgi:putative ATP-dependent endonuclease of OLD family